MEIFSPNTIGYTLLGYLIGTLITASTIVIVLKCVFPRGTGAANNHYRNGNNGRYGNGGRQYRRRNSLLPAAFLFLLAFFFFALVTSEWNMEKEGDSPADWYTQGEPEEVQQFQEKESASEPEQPGSSTTGRQEETYYGSSLGAIPVSNWRRKAEHTLKEEAPASAQYFIQKPASPNREIAREEAIDWAYMLDRTVSLAFDPGSSSSPYKVLFGPYNSREQAEADKQRLQTEGYVLDVSQKNWEIRPVQFN
ncbi:MAG: SPOR domain-containing protein [Lewinellaceae bacterium]|nr:SPOR domain-containing protein [Lewinellaceae bacterium]